MHGHVFSPTALANDLKELKAEHEKLNKKFVIHEAEFKTTKGLFWILVTALIVWIYKGSVVKNLSPFNSRAYHKLQAFILELCSFVSVKGNTFNELLTSALQFFRGEVFNIA